MGVKGDVTERLTAYLRELHLPTLRECFEELAQRALQESSSYQQYLLELVERECQARLTKRTERMLRDSRLPLEKDLASFDMARLLAKVSRQVRTLIEGSFVDRRENLLLFGKTGTGKTHLLSAIAQELVRAGRRRGVVAVCVVGSRVAEGQTRLETPPGAEADVEMRGAIDRRHRLCAAESRGDGSPIHIAGGSVRTRHGDAHQQPAVLEVGDDLQRPDDDGGGDRSPGASQRDFGTEHCQLPTGGGQAGETARGGMTSDPGRTRRPAACAPSFAGFAAPNCAKRGHTPQLLRREF